jgi:hypothetical protein
MQMLMMKAFLLSKDASDNGAASSSSGDGKPWVPKDGPDAVQKLAELTSMSSHPEVVDFAKTMKSNFVFNLNSDAASDQSDPIEPSV